MSKLFFSLLIIVAIFLEGIITSIPIVSLVLLIFYILKRTSSIFFLAFILGISLDVLSVRILGSSSAFFIAFIFIVFLYERKFEIATYPFVFFSSFLGGFLYLWIFGYNHVLEQSLASSLIAVLLFGILKNLNKMSNLKSQNHPTSFGFAELRGTSNSNLKTIKI